MYVAKKIRAYGAFEYVTIIALSIVLAIIFLNIVKGKTLIFGAIIDKSKDAVYTNIGSFESGPSLPAQNIIVTFKDSVNKPILNFLDKDDLKKQEVVDYINENIANGDISIKDNEGNLVLIFDIENISVVPVDILYYSQFSITSDKGNAVIQVPAVDMSTLGGKVKKALAGYNRSMFLMQDGTVLSVGQNSWGMLGDGTTITRTVPVKVKGGEQGTEFLQNVEDIALGFNHAVFLMKDGTVLAVGRNAEYQLGDGTYAEKRTPVKVKGGETGSEFLEGVKSIHAGGKRTIFWLKNGDILGVGENQRGGIGNGTIVGQSVPSKIKGGESGTQYLQNVKKIYAGGFNTVFLMQDGSVMATGYSWHGSLGNGYHGQTGSYSYTSVPIKVKGGEMGTPFLEGVIDIAAGDRFVVYLIDDGSVYAVGYNGYGQLGDDTKTEKHLPIRVKGENGLGFISDINKIFAGQNSTYLVSNDNYIYSTGYNNKGQLGNGTTIDSKTLSKVKNSDMVTDFKEKISTISTDYYHTILHMKDGTFKVIGYNDQGEFGNGNKIGSLVPVNLNILVP